MMKTRKKQRQPARAFTLVEMLVVISIIAVLTALVTPNLPKMVRSQKESAAYNLISSALAQAQGHAAITGQYAGIRFQFDKNGWQKGRQYLTLIKHTDSNIYEAIENAKPTALPKGIMVLDASQIEAASTWADKDNELDDDNTWNSMMGVTTFSIVFAPSGEIIEKDIYVYNRNADDIIFGSIDAVDFVPDPAVTPPSGGWGRPSLLYHDKHWTGSSDVDGPAWCDREYSATGLFLAHMGDLIDIDPEVRWSDYLVNYPTNDAERIVINHYTGRIIDDYTE